MQAMKEYLYVAQEADARVSSRRHKTLGLEVERERMARMKAEKDHAPA